MKKILSIFAVLAILLTMSCDEKPEEEVNPFVGEWESESGSLYIFTKTVLTVHLTDNSIYYTGTYIYDSERITVEVDLEKSIYKITPCILPYSFEKEKLYIYNQPLIKKN